MKKIFNLIGLGLVIFFPSCKKELPDSPKSETLASNTIKDLVVSDQFTYNTSTGIFLNFSEEDENLVFYSIYYQFDSQNKNLISRGCSKNGEFSTFVTIPSYCKELLVERNSNGLLSTETIKVHGKVLNHRFSRSNFTRRGDCFEKLYAVNSQGQFYWINNETGNFEEQRLNDLVGGGSIACAVDRENKKVFYNTNTTLRYYDIETASFHVVSNGNPFNSSYPRMEYNNTNGLLYIAKNEKMYILDPTNNSTIATIDLIGIQSPVGGGDVAISLDGTIYMCTFSGLYKIDLNGDILNASSANATRISAENLPFKPTSMAIDRNDKLYLATNDSKSQLIIMDKFDGAWSVVKTYDHTINDLGSLPCSVEELPDKDTDGDGIIDVMDDYPDDAEAAFDAYSPSELGWGSLGFEDLWPYEGDYDFNDMVINYRIIQVANSENQVVKLKCIYKVKAVVNSYKNGFGVELPIATDLIEKVTGSNLTERIINIDGKGLENGHPDKSVFIVFDNAFNNVANWGACANNESSPEIEMIIEFKNPINPGLLGSVPYNPFIFINGERGREVHLTSGMPTNLADLSLLGTKDDKTNTITGKLYKTENNLPWAINIIHDFRYPMEGIKVTSGYNMFGTWAESSGLSYPDWYKDNDGYRNANAICNQ